MTTHNLKLHDRYYDAVKYGFKRFEIRKNDRDFRVGDILVLTRICDEQTPVNLDIKGKYLPINPNYLPVQSDEQIKAKVTYILTHADFPDGIPEGYVVMTIEVF